MIYHALLDRFAGYMRIERGCSLLTLDSYLADLRQYFLLYNEPVNFLHANQYLLSLTKNVKPATLWRKRSALAQFFKFLWEEGLTPEDLSSRLHRPAKPFSLPKALSIDEVSRVLDFFSQDASACGMRRHAFVRLLYDTAARVSECTKLLVKNWHGDRFLVTGKRSKERWVFCTEETQLLVAEYMRCREHWAAPGNPYVWGRGARGYLLRQTVYWWLKEASQALNLPILSPHVLRHTQATQLMRHMNLIQLAAFLGHSGINTVSWYLRVRPGELCKRVKELWE